MKLTYKSNNKTAMVIIAYAKWPQFIQNRRRDHIHLMVLITACAKCLNSKKKYNRKIIKE